VRPGNPRAAIVFTDPPYNVPIDGHASGLGAIPCGVTASGSDALWTSAAICSCRAIVSSSALSAELGSEECTRRPSS